MYILCSHEMPRLFADRIPFANKSKDDTPIYRSSISVFECALASDKPLLIDQNTVKFVGFLPYVNTVVSQQSPHPTLRGKSFRDGVYIGGVQNYKASSTWRHKAVYVFNSTICKDEKISFYTVDQVTFSKPGLPTLISKGDHRYLPCDFPNPVRRGSEPKNFFAGINIHRGPQRKNPEWNYSLGCVTVDPEHLDTMMKFFTMNEMLIYIHNIDRIANDRDNWSLGNINGVDFNMVSSINLEITSQIEGIRSKHD